MTYLIQIEALNFGNYVYDTDDISTIRGGSLLLKKAIEEIDRTNVEPIRTGGSIGIFRMETSDKSEVEDWIKTTLQECRKTAVEATFCGAFVEESADEKDFQKDLNRLQSEIRIQQLQHPTFILPDTKCKFKTHCELDGRRPANETEGEDKKGKLSNITLKRRKDGRKMKAEYLNEIVNENQKDKLELKYTWDFEELSTSSNAPANLNGKIAFLHFDGNKFTKLSKKLFKNLHDITVFSKVIKERQNAFVQQYIRDNQKNAEFLNDGACRIEVLMWGGDEFDIVLPAWLGLEYIHKFMEINKGHQDKLDGMEFRNSPLTYSIGVVFCHHNAPILQIRRIAEDLIYKVKAKVAPVNPPESNDEGDAFHYLVLESIDMLAGSLDKFTDSYYTGNRFSQLLIKSGEFEDIVKIIQDFKLLFPRRKLYEILQAIKQGKNQEKILDIRKNALKSIPFTKRKWFEDELIEFEKHDYRELFLIADLWDYVQPSVEGAK